MPLMKSIDGRLYNVPDEEAAKFLIPPDQLAEALKQAGVQPNQPQSCAGQNAGQVQAYHWGPFHHHHYYNYYNYSNYYNHYGW